MAYEPQVLVRKYENDFAETKNITICAWHGWYNLIVYCDVT